MLIAIPAIAMSMAIMSMRNTTYSIQTSVYVVYLDRIGLVGTAIGVLFAAVEIASGFGALFAGRAMRLGNPQRTMLSGTVLSILLIAATPLLGGIFALLLLAQVARGWLEGVIQPVMFSVQAKAVGRHQQGAVVGLRQTVQRLSSIVIPPLMGWIADRWGTSQSFFVLGAMMLLLCAADRAGHPARGRTAAAGRPSRPWPTDRAALPCRAPPGVCWRHTSRRCDDARRTALRRRFLRLDPVSGEVLRSMAVADNRFDREHVAEEIEDLGKSERDAVRSQIRRIIEHFLKLAHSPAERAALRLDGDRSSMRAQTLSDKMSPTLRRDAEQVLDELYEDGRERAELALRRHGEHGAADALPQACPYSLDEICREDWYPDRPGEQP